MNNLGFDDLRKLWGRLAALEEQMSARDRDYLDLQRQFLELQRQLNQVQPSRHSSESDWLKLQKAAERLGVHFSSLGRWIRSSQQGAISPPLRQGIHWRLVGNRYEVRVSAMRKWFASRRGLERVH